MWPPPAGGVNSSRTLKNLGSLVWLALIAILGVWGGVGLCRWWWAREYRIFADEVVQPLRFPHVPEKGFWVGDVSELYRLGKISRELAEADTAPLRPLVPQPVPIHGYYVRAMESGPPEFDDRAPVSFKGQTWCPDNFAILIYPAVPGPGKRTLMWTRGALLTRSDEWTPVFRYPSNRERKTQWGIVD